MSIASRTTALDFERRIALGLLALALILEAVSVTGLCPSSLATLWQLVVAASLTDLSPLAAMLLPFLVLIAAANTRAAPLLACGLGGLASAALAAVAGSSGPDLAVWGGNAVSVAAVLAVALTVWRRARGSDADRLQANRVLYGIAITLLYTLAAMQLLELSAQLRPLTFDEALYRLDAAFGFAPSTEVARLVRQFPLVDATLWRTYDLIGPAITLLYGLQIRRVETRPETILDIMVVSGIAALVVYHLVPVAGPRFAFGDLFPDAMPDAASVAAHVTLTYPAPRNGMPSLHFGWALALAVMALRQHRAAAVLYAAFAALTVAATLSSGHHYLVDLLAALPFMLCMSALVSRGLPWPGVRLNTARRAAVLFAIWIIAIRFFLPQLADVPALLWILAGVSVLVSVHGFVALHRAVPASPPPHRAEIPVAVTTTPQRATGALVHALFFLSGAAALIYQVVFSKQLTYVFGSMSTATNSVLATYMAGIALGAWLGGMLADGARRPLRLYAICEFLIAIYCALSPLIFDFVQTIYVALGRGAAPDAMRLVYLRFFLGSFALLIPTILMGVTLPLLARYFERRANTLGMSVGGLYAANTLGAGLGALAAGYAVLPLLGVINATLLAALANLIVAALALNLQRSDTSAADDARDTDTGRDSAASLTRRDGIFALLVLALVGVVTLALEVNYIHLLAVVAGNSTYAFSLMLFAFLIGLGAGAIAARRLLMVASGLPVLAWLLVLLGMTVVLSLRQINQLAEYFAVLGIYPLSFGWGAREIIRGLVCCLAMMPPALLIGAIFPVAIDCVGRAFSAHPIRMLGLASALNTSGNILGVVISGFILLPMLGSQRALEWLALSVVVLALVTVAAAREWRRARVWPLLAVLGVTLWQAPVALDLDRLTSGANVYFAAQHWGHVIDHAESLDGGLSSVNERVERDGQTIRTLLTNGKFQGNDATGGEVVAQMGIGLAPLLHAPARDAALVIGYGTGNTARVLHDAGFRRLDVVDLSADIIALANRYFGAINARVTEQPGVKTYVTDGRNFLMLTEQRYDIISMEISSIWFAGAAALYSADYYALARDRLAPGGVLQQWMQLHHANMVDIYYVLGSLRTAFDHVWLYLIGQQGIIVASNDAAAGPRHLDEIRRAPRLLQTLAAYRGCIENVVQQRVLEPADIDRMLTAGGLPLDYFVSDDNNAFLEYSTPKGNVLDGRDSFVGNAERLFRYSSNLAHPAVTGKRAPCPAP